VTVTLRAYREGRLQDMEMDLDENSGSLGRSDWMLWLELEGATTENVTMLARAFGFNTLALGDSLRPQQRPTLTQ